jgi:hypothetical protein
MAGSEYRAAEGRGRALRVAGRFTRGVRSGILLATAVPIRRRARLPCAADWKGGSRGNVAPRRGTAGNSISGIAEMSTSPKGVAAMRARFSNARFATVIAAALALLGAGVVAGAAGDALIIGSTSNNSGTSDTQLLANTNITAFTLYQSGAGTALIGYVTKTTGNGRGVYGRTDSPNGDGVQARNGAATSGTGAAFRAFGGNNNGAVITSDLKTAIVGTATGCTGTFCGSYGVKGTGSGFAAGVYGDGTGSLFGVYGANGLVAGIYGFGSVTTPGVEGVSDYHGVFGVSGSAQDIDGSCGNDPGSFFACAGGVFTGTQNGALVMGDGDSGSSALGTEDVSCDFSVSPPTSCGWRALTSRGNVYIDGTLTVTGAKTGYVADYAINGSNVTLHQGDAVTLIGVRPAEVGQIPMLLVGPAKAGDTVIGVVDRMMKPAPSTATVKAYTVTITGPNGEKQTRDVPAKTVRTEGGGYGFLEGGTDVRPGEHLLVVTLGAYAYGSGDAAGGAIKAGDELMAGATAGKLVKAEKVTVSGKTFSVPGTSVGYALGSLNDGTGRIGIFVSPH